MDTLEQLGPLALASRLRRLAERLMLDGRRVYREQQLEFQPRWFPLFYLLAGRQRLAVGEAATALGTTHAAVSQTAREMTKRGLLSSTRDPADERRRLLALTERARELLPRLQTLWNDFEASAEELLCDGELLAEIAKLERALDERSLHERVTRCATAGDSIEIVDYRAEYRADFERLNLEWLEGRFRVEPLDREVLGDPWRILIEPGGAVLFARIGGKLVGCCGLQKLAPDCFELVKMAVTEAAQGHGIGMHLGRAALRRARELGARRVLIETNSGLGAALRIYQKLGFEPDPTAHSEYERGDVRLTLDLGGKG